ncbi:PH domain-containing protein [Xanthomonas sp. AmX2]|uniref:PH domain-containing protein n=1 Tax=Xanthomonas sp. TaxID=29446 RepID=UPI00197D87C3|nr:PH domain-containing protein [Xanthomonas sp.]
MSAAQDLEAAPERRLHPWSWLFVLLQQLRQFLLPLLVLAVFGGRSGRGEHIEQWIGVAVAAALVAVAVLRYLTYRYRIGDDGISIRSGLLQRSRREIPFARIHNVVVHQSLLHRLFGVAEVRLESAGGDKPEAEMRVLRLEQALALEQQVRHRARAGAVSAADAPAAVDAQQLLLALPLPEVLRLGLISNRGMVVVAAAFGAVYQLFPEDAIADAVERYGAQLLGYASGLQLGATASALGAALLAAALLLAMRALSVILALLQYHGFRLSETQRRLTVERGLLARLRTSVAQRRIQAWTLHEGALHRLFGRRSLRIDTAVVDPQGEDGRALKELAPLATPAACDALLQRLLPAIAWPPPQWRPVAARNWWRLCLPAVLVLAPASIALCANFGAWGALPLLLLPWSALQARQQARRMAYALDAHYLVVRGGWWTRWWRLAELDKLQALQLIRSPLDRRCGTATLRLDTAGASASAPPLRLRFLPVAEAQALYLQLGHALARRRLRW